MTPRNPLLWRDDPAGFPPTQVSPVAAPRVSVLAAALRAAPMWQDGPQPAPSPLPAWPLMTRVRLAIASARALLAR